MSVEASWKFVKIFIVDRVIRGERAICHRMFRGVSDLRNDKRKKRNISYSRVYQYLFKWFENRLKVDF